MFRNEPEHLQVKNLATSSNSRRWMAHTSGLIERFYIPFLQLLGVIQGKRLRRSSQVFQGHDSCSRCVFFFSQELFWGPSPPSTPERSSHLLWELAEFVGATTMRDHRTAAMEEILIKGGPQRLGFWTMDRMAHLDDGGPKRTYFTGI